METLRTLDCFIKFITARKFHLKTSIYFLEVFPPVITSILKKKKTLENRYKRVIN